MATDAYRRWAKAGGHYELSRWIVELEDQAHAADVAVLGDIGNRAHLQSDRPEDHAPFSFTAWPVPLPGYWVCAIDLADGPWSDRILAAARAGRLPWLKYLNFRGTTWSRRRDNFQDPDPSGDEHLHLSGMSNHVRTGLAGFNPFRSAPAGDDEEMKPILCNLAGRASVFIKWPNEPMRALESQDALDLANSIGATAVTAKTANALVNVLGPLAGRSVSETVAFVRDAG